MTIHQGALIKGLAVVTMLRSSSPIFYDSMTDCIITVLLQNDSLVQTGLSFAELEKQKLAHIVHTIPRSTRTALHEDNT